MVDRLQGLWLNRLVTNAAQLQHRSDVARTAAAYAEARHEWKLSEQFARTELKLSELSTDAFLAGR